VHVGHVVVGTFLWLF